MQPVAVTDLDRGLSVGGDPQPAGGIFFDRRRFHALGKRDIDKVWLLRPGLEPIVDRVVLQRRKLRFVPSYNSTYAKSSTTLTSA